jgi:drug/metabolite transporter (DMT)-like permease
MTGFLYVLTAAFMWGLIGVFTKFVLSQGVGALEIAFWRAMFGWVFFFTHALLAGQARAHRSDLPALFGFGFICVTLFYGAYQVAIRDVGMALAAVLLYTAPAWVALLSRLVLKERMTMVKALCVGMTILGAGLLSGFTYALYYIFGKKFLYRYPTPTIFVYALPFGALLLLPFIDFTPKSAETWLMLAGMALVTSYGAFSFYYAGLKRMDATFASIVATFEPVVAAVTAFLLFGEKFSMLGYAGSTLIIGAVLMVVMVRPGAEKAVESEA